MTKPFTQKHFGQKGMSTDDTHSMTKGAATMMGQSAVMSYGKQPIKQLGVSTKKEEFGPQQETKEERGKRVYQQAQQRLAEQKESAKQRAQQEAGEQRSSIRVKMGMGTSLSSKKIKLPRTTSGMGTSLKTHKFKM